MQRYLLFVLAGPLASWGETSGGQRRPTSGRPTKSAVTGLLAAALGLPRGHSEIPQLAYDLGFAVRVDRQGAMVRDYHTVQAPVGERGTARWRTRACELNAKSVGTSITTRDYRADGVYTVALWHRNGDDARLDVLARALRYPRWTLYLGRKSCPLGVPMRPVIREAVGLGDAIQEDLPVHTLIWDHGRPQGGLLYYEPDAEGDMAWGSENVAVDLPVANSRRSFATRRERIAADPAQPSDAPRPEDFF